MPRGEAVLHGATLRFVLCRSNCLLPTAPTSEDAAAELQCLNSRDKRWYYSGQVVQAPQEGAKKQVNAIRSTIRQQVSSRFANTKYMVYVARIVDGGRWPKRTSHRARRDQQRPRRQTDGVQKPWQSLCLPSLVRVGPARRNGRESPGLQRRWWQSRQGLCSGKHLRALPPVSLSFLQKDSGASKPVPCAPQHPSCAPQPILYIQTLQSDALHGIGLARAIGCMAHHKCIQQFHGPR